MESVEGNGAVAESGSYSVGEEGKELNYCEAGFSGNREFGVESIANAITHASKVTDFESARERMVDSIKIEDEFDHFSRVDGKLSSMESTDTDEKASVSERMHKMVESDSLKIEVIDETAVIDTTCASKLENGIGNEKGFVGFAKTDGMKEKRPQRRGKGAEKLSGSNGKEKILTDMDKAQNSLEKEGDGTKRAYSREEVEALRFVNLESQQKKWIEVYCGLAPIVAGEYDGLIACNRQKHIQINFDPRKQSGKKKKTPAVLGEDCFQVMNNETENMIPLDPSCGEDYSILEGECSEEDDSDDDYSSIQRPAFLVTGKPNFNSGPPQDGLEYLRRVRWEAAQIPKVKVSKLETSKLSKEQTVYMPKIPDIAKCPEHLLLLKQWEDAFIADFSELRLMSRPRPPSKALVPSSSKPNQLIVPPPLESITQSHSLEIVNRYQTLGNIHRPDYSSALASDPFASGHSVSVTPFPVNPIKPSRSEYTNSHVTNLFYKEPSHPKNQTINEIAKFHFGSGCHFTLLHPEKTLSYYKDILLHHHSILIKSIQDRTYAYKILYHSIYIHNIVSMAEWGNPNQLRGLPGHSIQYNYHDYVDAWFKIFLYQNENFSHSWFISFDQKFKSEIPTWFLRWWTHYGAISDILPIDLSKIINYFASVYPFTTYQQQFPLLLIFISKYKIPWIFKWHYGIDDNIIIRQHTVKWWVKFNVPRILEIVQEEFPPDQCAPTPALTKAQQNPTAAISQGSQPSLSPVNLGSPSSSGSKPKSKSKAVAAQPAQSKPKSKSKVKSKPISPPAQPKIKSRSISKSSKEDMIQLAHQLLNQAKTQSTDSDSSEEGSEHAHSSEESTNQCSGPEFQDAQDPFA